MAETAVGFVIDYLAPLLTEEAKLLRNVHTEVFDIRDELESIKCFLKDADMKAETDGDTVRDGVKEWVKQVTQVSFRIEDVIDEYIFHLAQHPRRGGFIGSLYRFGRCIIKLQPRHQIASQIQDIKVKVCQIKERSGRYGFDSSIIDQQDGSTTTTSAAASWYDPRKGALYLEEAEVVGIESPRAELIGWLLDEQQPHRTVISVVGMGGLGKTTLAKKVYDSVKQNFDCHIWVTVSQSYHKVELLKDIIKKFCEGNKEYPIPEGINAMDEEETLTNKLREYLLQKRYVVIFDDVWKVDFWGDIQHALLDNRNGGRIMITTRNMEVANFCRISSFVHVHRLKPLPYEKAWELFCNKVFKFDFEGLCPTYLEELSRNIVRKCEGLPLAIVAIAGLLSTKNKTIHEWQNLHDSLRSELESNPHLGSIIKILSLSYSDLPYHLKSCFLYFGMYPEDHSIRCSRLIRQWIAEGIVNQKLDKTSEAVANEYLTELIHRSLVRVSWLDSKGRVRNCRIHDLLREFALKKMGSSFCHVLSGNESTFRGEIVTRRLSILNSSCSALLHGADQISHQVRGILNFNKGETLLDYNFIPGTLAKNFKLLKLLDFEDAPIDSIHEDIGKLFHLRYLSLRNTKVKMLPRSIGKLVNLETLDLKQSFVSEIPAEIKSLHKLRQLLGYNRDLTMYFYFPRTKGIKLEEGFGSLKSLQKLFQLDVKEMGAEVIEELGNLTQLKRLGIRNLRSEDGRILSRCIEKMNHLECLDVCATNEDDMIDLESMSSPPQFLQRLYLYGRLSNLPEWIKELQNPTAIQISWSKLEVDPLETFKCLPNLLRLKITRNAYVGDELKFETGMFPKLKELDLVNLSGLKRIVIEEGSLVNLESLGIGPSPLEEVPSGIQHLKNLRYLGFLDMSEEFKKSMKPEGGQHYEIVQHVPRVRIHYARDGGKYQTLRLEEIN